MQRHPDAVASTTPRRSDTLRYRWCARIGQATSAIGAPVPVPARSPRNRERHRYPRQRPPLPERPPAYPALVLISHSRRSTAGRFRHQSLLPQDLQKFLVLHAHHVPTFRRRPQAFPVHPGAVRTARPMRCRPGLPASVTSSRRAPGSAPGSSCRNSGWDNSSSPDAIAPPPCASPMCSAPISARRAASSHFTTRGLTAGASHPTAFAWQSARAAAPVRLRREQQAHIGGARRRHLRAAHADSRTLPSWPRPASACTSPLLSLSLLWPYRVRATSGKSGGRAPHRVIGSTSAWFRLLRQSSYAPALFHLRRPRRADVASSPRSAPPCAAARSGRMAPTPECFVQSSSPSNAAILRTRGK